MHADLEVVSIMLKGTRSFQILHPLHVIKMKGKPDVMGQVMP